ncbi:MAG TPA: sigma-70 family RNA polymerase sigma factor [Thermoleophilaceae bacterium]|nr:sigma-70 family RNA polymerase sigma factor [Thermoleophilaceae bacterium]
MPDLRDPRQFNEAYRRHAGAARAAAARILRDEAAAEDVVQDVFMQLWLRPSAYDPGRGSLGAYVSMLARSRAVDRWRTRSARDAALQRSADEVRVRGDVTAEDTLEPVIRRDRRRRLASAIGELPTEQRSAMLLAYGRGMTAREIADATKIPLGTAKSRLRLGLQKARESLDLAA